VVYTGLTRAGAAGAGWDIPLSYVAWQKPQRNRPSGESGLGETPRRLIMSLGGSQQRMVRIDPIGFRFIPYLADGYMDLSFANGGWSLRTLDNLEYRFEPASALGGDAGHPAWPGVFELWLLTQVRDTVGGDKIVIEYDPTPLGSCKPDLRMKRLSYTYSASGSRSTRSSSPTTAGGDPSRRSAPRAAPITTA